ncbi:hypothetical protein ARALYDRAFT_476398, partial [Arabidopsis lyrata subsp. lyrata]
FDGIRGSNDNAYIKNGVYSLSELSMSKFLGVRKHLTSATFVLLFLSFPMTILFVCTCRFLNIVQFNRNDNGFVFRFFLFFSSFHCCRRNRSTHACNFHSMMQQKDRCCKRRKVHNEVLKDQGHCLATNVCTVYILLVLSEKNQTCF